MADELQRGYPWHTAWNQAGYKTERVYPEYAAGEGVCPPTGFGAPPSTPMTAEEILDRARDLISGERNSEHGDRALCHKNIADQWAAFLGSYLPPYRVALMMALLKIARTKTGKFNIDNFIDAVGYVALAGELAAKMGGEK